VNRPARPFRFGRNGLPYEGMASELTKAKSEFFGEVRAQGKILGGLVGFMWVVHLVNALVFQGHLVALGVHPRTLFGLVGVLFAPFLHGSFSHLVSNTMPMLVLGAFVMMRRKRDLAIVSALSALVGGLGTWLIAPAATVHVGASILVFGYLGYLLARGFVEKKLGSILGSLAVFFLYGGALFGVLPGQAGISWQGHLFGFLGGAIAAKLLANREPDRPKVRVDSTGERVSPPRARVAASREPVVDDDDEELEKLRRRVGR
jgi:membrane associated rhomboid family serine protease